MDSYDIMGGAKKLLRFIKNHIDSKLRKKIYTEKSLNTLIQQR